MRIPRGYLETLAVLAVLIFTAWNAVRIATAIAWRQVLEEFGLRPSVEYLVGMGLLWSLAGIALLYTMLWHSRLAGRFLLSSGIAYSAWYWLDRFLWQTPRPGWPVTLALNVIILGILLGAGRRLAKERHD